MALINCPECTKEVSDKVKTCHHCGYPFMDDDTQKVEVTSVKLQVNKGKQKKIIATIVVIIVIATIVYIGYSSRYQNQYSENLDSAVEKMAVSASDAENLLNLTGNVWSNAIFEEADSETDEYTQPNGYFVSDFNDALQKLYADEDTIATIADITTSQEEVAALMKKLKTPPNKYKDSYATLLELYNAYQGVTGLAVSPEGNLESFQNSSNEKRDEFVKLYKKLEAQLPE